MRRGMPARPRKCIGKKVMLKKISDSQKCTFPQLVAFQFRGEVTAVGFFQLVPVADALIDFDGHAEIVPQNASQRAGGVRTLRDQAGVPQEALVLDPQAAAQARGAHADEIEQRVRECVRPPIAGG